MGSYNIELLQEYIKALIVNIEIKNIPSHINVIFDGGAFNGGFALGIALYLKCMEEHKLLKVHAISGCSIGSVLAMWYLTGCKLEGITYFEQFMTSYKKNANLHSYKYIILSFINSIFLTADADADADAENAENADADADNAILNKLNGHLFITYYNIKKHKQKTVSRFKNKAHLIECIMRSSHIPYLMDGQASYNKKYMDGISPYILKNGLPNLFIKLLTFNKCTRAFMIKSENNIHYRLITGVADVNDFFTTGHSDMCSFVDKWSYLNIFQLRFREILSFLIFSLIGWLIVLKNYLPKRVTNSLLYNGTINSVNGLYSDLVGKILV
jgi:hypothetical protein